MQHQHSSSELPEQGMVELLALAFAPHAAEGNVRALLRHLNTLTEHRFTGIYRFEPGWVVSVALWDRDNPALEVSADVKMKESYCWLTGLGESSYVIEDACSDARIDGHPAQDQVRSYTAVLLRDRQGNRWGTLCHFDFAPRRFNAQALQHLEICRPLIEEIVVRDRSSQWDPDAPSEVRRTRLGAVADLSGGTDATGHSLR